LALKLPILKIYVFFMKVMDVAGIIPWAGERRRAEFGAFPPL
jgi:hypothetical protein